MTSIGSPSRVGDDVGQHAERQGVFQDRREVGVHPAPGLEGASEQRGQLRPARLLGLVAVEVFEKVDLGDPVEGAPCHLAFKPDALATQQEEIEPAVGQSLVLEDPAEA